VKLNATTFGTLIAGLYKEEKFEEVGKVLELLKEHAFAIGIGTCNTRIQCLCKLKRMDEAKELLDGWLLSGMKANSITYRNLVHGYCKEWKMDKAKDMFEEMVKNGFKPDSNCYFTLVSHMCKGGEFEDALKVCKQSMEKGWAPNFSTIKMLVVGLGKGSMVQEARELVGQLKERFPENAHMWDEWVVFIKRLVIALGIHNVEDFDFIDGPYYAAIETAIKSFIQLGAVVLRNGVHKLTKDEGLVLAAVMANSSSIFCRVGDEEDKQKSDCLKVQFCYKSGDLFTLLSVYSKWECVPHDQRNHWCFENSINAKSMCRCQEAVQEMESCLRQELNIIIPTHWRWNPEGITDSDKILKDIILSALALKKILDVFLPRGDAIENPPVLTLEEALLREVSLFMPVKSECVSVRIFPCEPRDSSIKAEISFDGSVHLEAAKALEQIDRKALPGCQPWQKIKTRKQFRSSV
ncbi:ATP-dependent RNA helicase DEAH11, chloroplastic-like protein, partial [Tanacetum coccineum]